MTPQGWERLADAFAAALALDGPERQDYLVQVAESDPALAAEIERLLDNHRRACNLLESHLEPLDKMLDRRAGPYRLIRKVGEGGMGTVYLAERADGHYRSQVAVKLLRLRFEAGDAIRRFRNERQVLAALDHPGIARLLDGGAMDDGVPYLVMEYVNGARIDHWCDSRKLSVPDRLRLFSEICAAVEYAHGRQVIHRDIKPDNILVNNAGKPKLLDFGIAKVLDPELHETATTTSAHALMTPQYASPEQVRGDPVTTATDVYALGLILYKLLTGQLPYELRGGDPAHLVRTICETEPGRPSAASITEEAATSRGESLPELQRRLSGNLDVIVLKALRKEPERRYASVREFSDDVERHLNQRPVRARPDAVRYRATKFVKRHRAAIGSALAVAVLVLALVTFWTPTERTGPPVQQASVLVLPFENATGDSGQDRLADALTEGVISEIGKIRSVRVISAESAMLYKKERQPAREIAKKFGVPAVVTGALNRTGDRLRATIRLLTEDMERARFERTYERDLREVAALQKQLARAVSEAVHVQLTAQEDKRLASWGPVNKDAYEAWLKGRHYLTGHTVDDLQRSLRYFQQAVQADPAFALGWIGVADAYFWLSELHLAPHEAMPKAKAALQRALEIDDSIPEANTTAGAISATYDWDWSAAERSLKRAIDLAPSYAQGRARFSDQLMALGRFDEAIVQAKEAIRLDPIPAEFQANLAWIYAFARRTDEAIETCRKALETDPGSPVVHFTLARIYYQTGRYRESLDEFEKGHEGPTSIGFSGYPYARMGMVSEAQRVIAALNAAERQRYVSGFQWARIYVGLENVDKTFEYLEKAFQQRSEEMTWLKVDPVFDPIRKDPRYLDLLRRMNLL